MPLTKKDNKPLIRKKILSNKLGEMLEGNSIDELTPEDMQGYTNQDVVDVIKGYIAAGKMGDAKSGMALVKLLEYQDKRGEMDVTGIPAHAIAGMCIEAIRELKKDGYRVVDAPEIVIGSDITT